MDPDDTLVRRVVEGDNASFRPLIERYKDAVYGVALSKTGRRADAEDIAQETFFAAYEKLTTLHDPARFGSWLYGIALNKARMHLRSNAQRTGPKKVLSTERDGPPRPDEIASQRETHSAVRKALARLPDAQRETVALFYINGYSH